MPPSATNPATSPKPRPTQTPEGVAILAILVNTLLAITKLIAGIIGNSFALVADAVESIVDIVGSAVVWGALRYGNRPPDQEHPFGHGKAESLAALAVACFVLFAGLAIGAEAIRQLLSPSPVPAPFTLVILLIVIVIKESLFRITRRVARDSRSTVSHSDAWHHRSDAITSLFALLGISIALIGGPDWAAADKWAALAASVVILFNAVRLFREPYSELMDRNDDDIADQCQAIALETPAIRAIERSEARKSGRLYRVVMHAEVDPDMTVADSHALTGIVKSNIRERLPSVASVLIHIEPHTPHHTTQHRQDEAYGTPND